MIFDITISKESEARENLGFLGHFDITISKESEARENLGFLGNGPAAN